MGFKFSNSCQWALFKIPQFKPGVLSSIRGHHVYKTVWTLFVGEILEVSVEMEIGLTMNGN